MLGEQRRSGARARAHAPRLWATSPRRGAAPAAAPRGQPARAEPGLTQGAPAEEPCGCGGAGLARVLNADQHQLQLLHLEEPPEDAAHRGRRVCPRGGGSRARPGQQRGTHENTRKVPGAAASESTRAVEPCGSGGWGSRARRGGGIQETRGQSGRFTCFMSTRQERQALQWCSPRRGRLGGFGRLVVESVHRGSHLTAAGQKSPLWQVSVAALWPLLQRSGRRPGR